MSGTFALAAKVDLSQYDMEIQSALLAGSKDRFDKHVRLAKRALKTLREDLGVYKDRSLETTNIDEIIEGISEMDIQGQMLLSKWVPGKSGQLQKDWRDDKTLKKVYRQLTTNYDDAAVVGYKFRLSSEDKIERSTRTSLIALGVGLIGSFLLSVWLSFLIISPLNRIQSICQEVSVGNFAVRAKRENRDEFGLLAASFNLMLDNIEEKRENMSSLLTTIPFALFYFDQSGKISSERSLATEKIFPALGTSQNIYQFFQNHGESAANYPDVVDVMYSNAIPFNSAAFLLPQQLKVVRGEETRLVQLSYQAKRGAKKKLERIIILGEDITEKEKAKSRSQELTERVERISRASADMQGFRDFLPEVKSLLVKSQKELDVPTAELQRDLHSLKGILGIYAFNQIAEMVHQLESEIGSTRDESSSAIRRLFNQIRETFTRQAEDVSKILALDPEKKFRAYDEKKINAIRKVAEETGNRELIASFENLERYPLDQVFSKYANYIHAQLEKVQEKRVRLEYEKGSEVSYEELRPLDQVLIHLFNNCIDHGIEPLDERLSKGKDETGIIRIAFDRKDENFLQLTIKDDGRGIDGKKLLEKARQSGTIPLTQTLSWQEQIELIFQSGLSSKEEATLLSGRGIGMDAVKNYLETKGGSISISSQPGTGTEFIINFPVENQHVHHTS